MVRGRPAQVVDGTVGGVVPGAVLNVVALLVAEVFVCVARIPFLVFFSSS